MYLKKTFSLAKHSDTYVRKRQKGIPTEYDRFGGVFLNDSLNKGNVKKRKSFALVNLRSVSRAQYRSTVLGQGKRPYNMKCKNGPGCKNHDWGHTSPLRMVCKNGPGCR